MHAIFFGLKRAHHGVLRITRGALAKLGLTPARFDLLYAVFKSGLRGAGQSAVRRVLGVSAPTVSRMLGSLEDLGMIRREVHPGDRRRLIVHLTKDGMRRIRRGVREFCGRGLAQLAVDSALCPDDWFDDMKCLTATDECDGMLNRFRRAYRDVATLHFPWHPDD
jgi:DNA-binding MarR family transcriptional regulator